MTPQPEVKKGFVRKEEIRYSINLESSDPAGKRKEGCPTEKTRI